MHPTDYLSIPNTYPTFNSQDYSIPTGKWQAPVVLPERLPMASRPSVPGKSPLQSRCAHHLETPKFGLVRFCPACLCGREPFGTGSTSCFRRPHCNPAAQNRQWRTRYPGCPRFQWTTDSGRHLGILQWGHAEDRFNRPRPVRGPAECRENLCGNSGPCRPGCQHDCEFGAIPFSHAGGRPGSSPGSHPKSLLHSNHVRQQFRNVGCRPI